jgi:hypothetical protein
LWKAQTTGREGGLRVVSDGDTITVCQLKEGGIPFKDKPAAMMFTKENLWTEESDFQSWNEEVITLEDRNASGAVHNLVMETTPLVCNKLFSDAIHGKGNLKVNEGSRNEVGLTWAHRLGAPGVNNAFNVAIRSKKVTGGGFEDCSKM